MSNNLAHFNPILWLIAQHLLQQISQYLDLNIIPDCSIIASPVTSGTSWIPIFVNLCLTDVFFATFGDLGSLSSPTYHRWRFLNAHHHGSGSLLSVTTIFLRIHLSLPGVGIGTGNPGVFQGYPYPYLRKPTPVPKGMGTGMGSAKTWGYSTHAQVCSKTDSETSQQHCKCQSTPPCSIARFFQGQVLRCGRQLVVY